jgi:ATP-binding cassette subfamily C protein CydD
VVRRVIATSVAIGLVSSASVVAQALALAHLLASAMHSSGHGDAMPALAWLAGAAALRGACALAAEVVAAHGAEAAKAGLRTELVNVAVHRVPSGGIGGSGDVATIAGYGLDALDAYVGRYLPDLVLAALVPIALAAVIGALDWVSAVIVVVAIALFPLFGTLVGQSSGRLAGERWRQVQGFGGRIADIFEGLPVLKAFGRSAHQRQQIALAGEALKKASMSTLRVAFLSALVLDTLASVSVALVAVPLGLRLLDGSVALSSALAVLIVAPEVFLPLRRASAGFHESAEGLAAARRAMDSIEAAKGDPHSSAAPRATGVPFEPADPAATTVELRNVGVEVPGRSEPLLDAARLAIGPGEVVVLVGPNGAGKSTVLSLLLGFVTPTSGSVTVGGNDLRDVDLGSWRRLLAYLPERPTLLASSLADNLRLANPHADDESLVEAMVEVGAHDLLDALPRGLDTPMGEGGRPVSAGERQRIALARVLLRPASLFLFDEPTVHLDNATEGTVVHALRRRLEGRSALIVTHRAAVIDIADRVVSLSGGRFVESGASLPGVVMRNSASQVGRLTSVDRRPS